MAALTCGWCDNTIEADEHFGILLGVMACQGCLDLFEAYFAELTQHRQGS